MPDAAYTDLLKQLLQARHRREETENEVRRLALEALEMGVSRTSIAGALGVTRMTVWRWEQEANQ